MTARFVVLEGMDGSGTTTQARMLTQHLRENGFRVVQSAEPTGSLLGQEARRLLAMPIDKEPNLLASLALCFAADRMQHIHEVISPALGEQDFIILDRYVLSSLVYQGLHLPTAFVQEINRFALSPDLTIVLDLEVNIAHARLVERSSAKDFYESPKLLEQIRGRYLNLAKDSSSPMVLIDSAGSMNSVHEQIMQALEERFHDLGKMDGCC